MKKNIIITVICSIVILGFLVILNLSNKNNIKEINYQKLNSMLKNKDSFVLELSQTWCPHCKRYKEVLYNVGKKYNLNIYVLQLDIMSEKDHEELIKRFHLSDGTPTILFIDKGQEKSELLRYQGERTYEETIDLFQNAGVIKR